MKDNWKIILLKVIGTILVLFFSFLFVISFNKGSNADVEKGIATIICWDDNTSTRVTWDFYKLDSADYKEAVAFAGRNNCTFESSYEDMNEMLLELNETGGIK